MRDERGSVSVIVAAIVAAMVVLGLGAADLARVLVAASQAQAAADSASLAAVSAFVVVILVGMGPRRSFRPSLPVALRRF